MIFAGSLFVVLLAIFLKRLTRSFFHPSVIVGLIWGITTILYLTLDHPLWSLSSEFLNVFSCWVVPFMISAYAISHNIENHSNFKTIEAFNYTSFRKFYPFVILASILLIVLLIYYSGGVGKELRQFMLNQPDYPSSVKFLVFVNGFSTIFGFYALLHIEDVGRRRVYIIFLLLLLIAFLKSAKGAIFRLFIGIIFILYRRREITIPKVLISGAILITLLISVTLFRGDLTADNDNALLNYVYIYILSPFTAFDMYLNNEISVLDGTSGSASIPLIFNILNKFGFNIIITRNPGWVTVPVLTNVYTAIWGFYYDAGWLGVFVWSIVLGAFWGAVYRTQQSGNQIAVLFYASTCFSLVFQGFGDFFMESLSLAIQYYLFSLILTRGVIIYKKTKRTYSFFNLTKSHH